MPRNSPLLLESYFVKEMYFALNPGFDFKDRVEDGVTPPDTESVATIGVSRSDPNRFRCEVAIKLLDDPSSKFPYTFKVTLVGVFSLEEPFPEDQLEFTVKPNAAAILYAAARELILTMTLRSHYPAYLLRTVSFAPRKGEQPETAQKQIPAESKSTKGTKKTVKRKTSSSKKKPSQVK